METHEEDTQVNTATCVAKHIDGWRGHTKMYRLDPPATYQTYTWFFKRGLRVKKTSYVIVSAIKDGPEGEETFIYPCDCYGNDKGPIEMRGSLRGTLDHEKVLLAAGYLVVL